MSLLWNFKQVGYPTAISRSGRKSHLTLWEKHYNSSRFITCWAVSITLEPWISTHRLISNSFFSVHFFMPGASMKILTWEKTRGIRNALDASHGEGLGYLGVCLHSTHLEGLVSLCHAPQCQESSQTWKQHRYALHLTNMPFQRKDLLAEPSEGQH